MSTSPSSLRLLMFGATGGTGLQLVQQALERGHQVTAYLRNPAKLKISSPNLRIEQGELLDEARIQQVVPNHDAVLSALGVMSRKPTTLQSDATLLILRAMEAHNVRRLVYETSLGVGDGRDRTGFVFGKIILPLFLKQVFLDKDRQETAIRGSSLDWVIVRPGGLTNGPRTGTFRAKDDGSIAGGVRISRADVAAFMLDQCTSNEWLRRTPELAY